MLTLELEIEDINGDSYEEVAVTISVAGEKKRGMRCSMSN